MRIGHLPWPSLLRLDSHRNRDQMMDALDKNQGDELTKLLRDMRRDGFKKKKGGRWDAKKVRGDNHKNNRNDVLFL